MEESRISSVGFSFDLMLIPRKRVASMAARGAASRRRERKLRCFWCHEHLSVKMAVVFALRHSSDATQEVVEVSVLCSAYRGGKRSSVAGHGRIHRGARAERRWAGVGHFRGFSLCRSTLR